MLVALDHMSLTIDDCEYALIFCGNISEQVSVWDGIIPAKEHAKFQIQTSNKYRLIDQVLQSFW